ncbi:MAG TPA: hypothetical protein VMP68_12830 [Candidatus Eisenbacteria bacterium]|nr:hypothetical protein [Candidatus Eisenbacteria bacterium]
MKKIGMITLLTTATVLFAIAFPAAAAGPKPPVPAVVGTPAVPAATPVPPESHPHIHEALEAMRTAQHELQTAEHDFSGHRQKSLEHLNQAIREAEICESMK